MIAGMLNQKRECLHFVGGRLKAQVVFSFACCNAGNARSLEGIQ
jgi:hypothetical protein